MEKTEELTVFITGATDGLGKMLAERMAGKGARVLLHGRDPVKGKTVMDELIKKTGNRKLDYFNADFSSLKSVADLGKEMRAKYSRIHRLVNNAAIGGGPNSSTERELGREGYELRFTVNYLSQVLITQQLLPLMDHGGRIVNVASVGQTALDFDDVMMDHGYNGYRAYAQSKLALIMFTIDLAEKLKEKGVTVNALHPATLMKTNMVLDHFGRVMSTVEEGCDALEYLALSSELGQVTGKYFNGKEMDEALPQAYDLDARSRLAKITEKLLSEVDMGGND